MSVDDLAELLPPTVRDLVYALADIRTLSSGRSSKRNNDEINRIAGNALARLEESLHEME